MTEDTSGANQDFPVHKMMEIWTAVKTDEIDQLEEEEKQLALLMQDHAEEYGDEFDSIKSGELKSYDPETEKNPFLHIMIHASIENQLATKEPIEAYQFFNTMRSKKVSRHESVHLVGCFLAHLMYDVMVEHKPFDNDRYKFLLKRYKGKKPASIYADMEKGFK